MKFRQILMSLILYTISFSIRAQVIVPNTPSAAALLKSLQSTQLNDKGLPNIGISLLNASMRGGDFPLTMRYNSGGFKISEESGWVGLGWYLDCEFQVSRKINGIDDFLQDGYPKSMNNLSLPGVGYQTQYKLANGIIDGEPDEFSYRLKNGKSGTFYFQPHGSLFLPVSSPDPRVKIAFNATDYSFKIIDTDGTTYYFASKSGSDFKATDGFELSSSIAGQAKAVITWKCTKIEDFNKKNVITFNYVEKIKTQKIRGRSYNQLYTDHQNFLPSLNYPPIYYSNINWGSLSSLESFQSSYPFFRLSDVKYMERVDGAPDKFVMLGNGGYQSNSLLSQYNKSNQISEFKKTYAQLSSIIINNSTTIGFELNSTSEELNRITISENSSPMRSVNFFYSKPTASFTIGTKVYQFSTAYLDSLVFRGSENKDGDKYGFLYFNKPVFGSHLSRSDAWGYSNGNTFAQLLSGVPGVEVNYPYSFVVGSNATDLEYPDATRSMDGVLNGIIYPTGGVTKYSYENHKYSYDYLNNGDEADFANGVFTKEETGTAILSAGGLRIKAIRHYNGQDTYPESSSIFSYGFDGTGEAVHKDDIGLSGFVSAFSYPPNSYQGWIFKPYSSTRIINYLAEDYSSGQTGANRFSLAARETLTTFRPRHHALAANNYGASVYYDKITEHILGRDSIVGKIEHFYYKPSEITPQASDNLKASIFIPGTDVPKLMNYWFMALKKAVKTFEYKNGKYILRRENRYQYRPNTMIGSLPVAYSYFNSVYENALSVNQRLEADDPKNFPNLFSHITYEGSDMDLYDPTLNYSVGTAFNSGNYNLNIGSNLVSRQDDIEYNNNDSVVRSKTFEYKTGLDNRIVSTAESRSNQPQRMTTYTYPDDSTAVAAYNFMSSNNNIEPVLKRKVTVNSNNVIENAVYNMSPNATKAFLSLQAISNNNVLSERTSFLKFDDYGNPLHVVKKGNINTVYIWGKSGKELLFNLENMNYQELINCLDTLGGASNILNNLNAENVTTSYIAGIRSKLYQSLKSVSVMLRSYEYDSLGLLSTIYDPRNVATYYQYDDQQRLIRELDKDGNILKNMNYRTRSTNSNWFQQIQQSNLQVKDIAVKDPALSNPARLNVSIYFDQNYSQPITLKLEHIESGKIYEWTFNYPGNLNGYNFYSSSADFRIPLGEYKIYLGQEPSQTVFFSSEMAPMDDYTSLQLNIIPQLISLQSSEEDGYYFVSFSGLSAN